ncbi:flagellar basal body P-ring biosynthesis protein, partial [Mycobacterium avium subsp. paratuberculosis 11-1786]
GSKAAAGARIVPLHPADGALIDLVRPGDVVDVLAAPANTSAETTHAAPKVLATDAVVVLVSAREKIQAAGADRVVWLRYRLGWRTRWQARRSARR